MILLDGKKTSKKLLSQCKIKTDNINITLAVILVGDNPASKIYVKNKRIQCKKNNIKSIKILLPEDVTQDDLINNIKNLNKNKDINGILVQLPLPNHIDEKKVIESINPNKDVDGFSPMNIGNMFLNPNFKGLKPATPYGIEKILEEYDIDVKGKNVVVVGRSNIVGKPISTIMLNKSATVSVCHSKTKNLEEYTKKADILIVAVGVAKLIKDYMVKNGVVVIDAGINRLENKKIVGDVDFENVSKKSSYITPVPGGVGPMTIASLIINTIKAYEIQNKT